MSSLPIELDFSTASGREASPERMNRAMEFIMGRFRAIEALAPEIDSTLNTLRELGLVRIAEVLAPIFDQATAINATLETILEDWQGSLLPAQVRTEVTAAVTAAFADYRNRYQGAKAAPPTVRPDGTPVAIGDTYFDTTLDAQRVLGAGGWKNAGSAVSTILNPFDITATASQTVFPIPGGYDTGMIIVAKNGTLLTADDFTATDGANVVLAAPAAAGNVISGFAFGAITTSSVFTKAEADGRFRLIADSYTKTEVNNAVVARALTSDVYLKSAADNRFLLKGSNLSDLTDAVAGRQNLGLGSAAVRAEAYFAKAADVYTKAEADGRYALTAAVVTLATGDGRYAAKDGVYTKVESDGAFLRKDDNLAALTDKAAARQSLGLGSAAQQPASAFLKTGTGVTGTISGGTVLPDNSVGLDGDVFLLVTG